MENASKALIIAGAILISIVLIGVGVLIVNSAQGIFGQGSMLMSQQEIDAFNAPFVAYEGRQNGSNVRALIGKLSTHNVTYQDDDGKLITFQLKGSAAGKVEPVSVSGVKALVSIGESYTVSFDYDNKTGLITNIKAE